MKYRRRKSWELPESALTEESTYLSRRRFIKAMGAGGLLAAGAAAGGRRLMEQALAQDLEEYEALTSEVNEAFADAGRAVTDPSLSLRYNNFYEFTTTKERVWIVARDFELDPYSLEVTGLVDRPGTLGLEQIEALGIEERVYRFRCVEAWAMTVPWTGIPLRALLEHVGVQSDARYVSFQSFLDPAQAPNQVNGSYYTWPYYEAIRIDEAMNDLAFVATGIYGRRLPPQSGAPLRIVLPWKYGYKGAKSVVRMQLTAERPPTFWHDLQPDEYSWLSNVNPEVPHPRWSQATERLLGESGRVPTQIYNGYADQVASLYES